MKTTFILLSAFFIISTQGTSQYASGLMQPDTSIEMIRSMEDLSHLLSTTIHATDLKNHLTTLSSDDFKGRETGTPGIDMAADYIETYLDGLDLPKIGDQDSYGQEVAFTFTSLDDVSLAANDQEYRHLWDYLVFPQFSVNIDDLDVREVVFAGYGIDSEVYSDYSNGTVDGKVVMVFDSEPTDLDGNSILTGQQETTDWATNWQLKSAAAKNHGAKLLLIVSNDIKSLLNENRRLLVNSITQLGDKSHLAQEGVNTLFISSTLAEYLLGESADSVIALRDQIRKEGRPIQPLPVPSHLKLDLSVNKRVLKGKNVLAYIEGSDKKDELVIVSAHYDHVGSKGQSIYNGADDNGSGTSTVLEIVEALKTAQKMGKGPRRSVLCMLLTGEEKGLLGSQYYVENPIFPISQTIANVNIDMVGRRGSLYQDDSSDYIYVIGSDRLSKDLHYLNERVNQSYSQMLMDYKYNDEKDPNRFYYRSDHFNFARKGIPAIFFFNGTHEDYHRTTDTIDKIDFDLMERRARLIFHTTWALANDEQKIRLTEEVVPN